jgi:hypothetical protein
MDKAVKKYYAGFPEEAISMIKPLALSGNVDAQYLLGNILYSLSKAGGITDFEDPVKWYKMAAEKDVADANYALGAIFHNKWNKSRDKNDAANAIIYYQVAIELGFSKAQQPLDRIKFRSRISPDAAAILVKEQEARAIPKSASMVQISDNDISSLASDESQAANSSTLTKNHTTTKSAPLDKPEVTAKDPIKIAKIADEPADEDAVAVIKSEPLDEPDVAAKEVIKIAQIVDESEDEVMVTVTLEEIANQCQKYTETGFNFYAETIEGALLSGKASVIAVKPDPAEPGSFRINFSSKLLGLMVFVDLHDVPEEIAVRFEKGNRYAITGIIVNSKVVGSDCAVRAMHQKLND